MKKEKKVFDTTSELVLQKERKHRLDVMDDTLEQASKSYFCCWIETKNEKQSPSKQITQNFTEIRIRTENKRKRNARKNQSLFCMEILKKGKNWKKRKIEKEEKFWKIQMPTSKEKTRMLLDCKSTKYFILYVPMLSKNSYLEKNFHDINFFESLQTNSKNNWLKKLYEFKSF